MIFVDKFLKIYLLDQDLLQIFNMIGVKRKLNKEQYYNKYSNDFFYKCFLYN